MKGFAKINDVAPEGLQREVEVEKEDPKTGEYQVWRFLPYIRCIECKAQFQIHKCYPNAETNCGKYDDSKHTHVACKCKEVTFSGVVSFRTERDTDAFNVRKPDRQNLTWDEKKKLLEKT